MRVWTAGILLLAACSGSSVDRTADLPPANRVLLVPAQYATVQDAVTAAGAGDRILVSPGVYPGTVIITGAAKNGLQIIADGHEGQVTLRGDHTQRTAGTCMFHLEPICPERAGFFLRDVNGVIIRGFTVTDFGVGPMSGIGEGFLLVNAHRNRIEGNVVTRTDMMGVTLFNSSENLVERNTLHSNDPEASGRVGTGCGVHIQTSAQLSPGSAERNTVTGNVIHGNPFAAVMLHAAGSGNQIVNNELRDGGAWGIVNTSTNATVVRDNRITRHTGFKLAGKPRPVGSGVGIGIVTSADAQVTGNTLSQNSAADIEWDGAGRNVFARNRCVRAVGGELCESSEN